MADLLDVAVRVRLAEQAWEKVGGPTLCEDCYLNGFESGLYHRTPYGVDVLTLPAHTVDWQVGYKHGRNLKVEGWPLPPKKDRVQGLEGDGEWTDRQGKTLEGMQVLCLSATETQSVQEVWGGLQKTDGGG